MIRTTHWFRMMIVLSIMSYTDLAPTRYKDIVFVRVGLGLLQISCDKEHMKRYISWGIHMCGCVDNHFLHIRNHQDTKTARCDACTRCTLKSRPYERQKCGKQDNTVCCARSNMTVVMTEHGYFDCIDPEPDSAIKPTDDYVADRCSDGYFHSNTSNECTPCSVCTDLPETPFQLKACTNISNTLCCANNSSRVLKTESGSTCSTEVSEATTKRPPGLPGESRTTTGCDKPNMHSGIKDSYEICICDDGSSAPVTEVRFSCAVTTGPPAKGNTTGKQKNLTSTIMIIVIVAMVILGIVLCCCQRKRWKSRFGSNRYDVEKRAKKKAKELEEI